MINFTDLARGGTAPSQNKQSQKHSKALQINEDVCVRHSQRPKTISGAGDGSSFGDFNASLRHNKQNLAGDNKEVAFEVIINRN